MEKQYLIGILDVSFANIAAVCAAECSVAAPTTTAAPSKVMLKNIYARIPLTAFLNAARYDRVSEIPAIDILFVSIYTVASTNLSVNPLAFHHMDFSTSH